MRQLENRTLRYNKNAQTLIATAGQKHSVYEPIVADFYDDHFSNDPLSTAYAAHIRSRSQRSRMTRRRLLNKTAATLAGNPKLLITHYTIFYIEYHTLIMTALLDVNNMSGNPVAQSLRLGPIANELSTIGGTAGHGLYRQRVEAEFSARPFPPFPLKKEPLLLTESELKRIVEVYMISIEMRKKRGKTAVLVADDVSTGDSCSHCSTEIRGEFKSCSQCSKRVHDHCFGVEHSAGGMWVMQEEVADEGRESQLASTDVSTQTSSSSSGCRSVAGSSQFGTVSYYLCDTCARS